MHTEIQIATNKKHPKKEKMVEMSHSQCPWPSRGGQCGPVSQERQAHKARDLHPIRRMAIKRRERARASQHAGRLEGTSKHPLRPPAPLCAPWIGARCPPRRGSRGRSLPFITQRFNLRHVGM